MIALQMREIFNFLNFGEKKRKKKNEIFRKLKNVKTELIKKKKSFYMNFINKNMTYMPL